MAYFGQLSAEKSWTKIEPRMIAMVLWITACIGLIVYLGAGSFMSAPQNLAVKEKENTGPMVSAPVLVPKDAISPGQKLRPELFTLETRPIQGIETKVVRDLKEIEGSYASSLIAGQAPLLRDYITFVAPMNAVTSKIPEGYRGVTISVNEESAVEGWVRPGVKVDVVWAYNLNGRPMVTTIVQNAEVLSAERSTEVSADGNKNGKVVPSHITLLVSLKDAQRIQLAKTSGSLSINLRGATDERTSGSETITVDRLLKAGQAGLIDDTNGWVEFNGKEYGVAASGRLIPSELLKDK